MHQINMIITKDQEEDHRVQGQNQETIKEKDRHIVGIIIDQDREVMKEQEETETNKAINMINSRAAIPNIIHVTN